MTPEPWALVAGVMALTIALLAALFGRKLLEVFGYDPSLYSNYVLLRPGSAGPPRPRGGGLAYDMLTASPRLLPRRGRGTIRSAAQDGGWGQE